MPTLLLSKAKDIEGFPVTRILPQAKKRMVGPFIFIDHMGPVEFEANEGLDVKAHPHIGLATLTYMLHGNLLHQDSLGTKIEIVPGDVNLMTAGKGIVHSEREPIADRSHARRLEGIQCWLALPETTANMDPAFEHIKHSALPQYHQLDGINMHLIAGSAFNLHSPLSNFSTMFLLDVVAATGSRILRPNPEQECLLYLLEGSLEIDQHIFQAGQAVLLGQEDSMLALNKVRCLLLGGEAWEKIPYIDWNFVSFSQTTIAQAKQDWQEQRMPKIPGDSDEFIPYP
tara:strand:- start:22514 stop:23368 length:855 start_codon:yes stop_codon:yes gene_type:complete